MAAGMEPEHGSHRNTDNGVADIFAASIDIVPAHTLPPHTRLQVPRQPRAMWSGS